MEKKYSKSYKIYQVLLFFAIVLTYGFYLIFGAGRGLAGLSAANVHIVAIFILITQIHTLLDIFKKLSKVPAALLTAILAVYSIYLTFIFYFSGLHIMFTVVSGLIGFSYIVNMINTIAALIKKK